MNKINIPLDLVIMEDEEFMLDDLRVNVEEELREVSQPQFFDRVVSKEDLDQIVVCKRVHCTDNIEEATRLVNDGRCDVILADYMVKDIRTGKKGSTSAIPFLRQTRERRPFISIVEHTAFALLHHEAAVGNLALRTHSKRDRNSVRAAVRSTAEVTKDIALFRAPIAAAALALAGAAESGSPVEKQEGLARARLLLTGIRAPQFIPEDYRKALVLLTNCSIRLSSVPSDRYGLKPISGAFVATAAPIFPFLRLHNG